MSNTCNDYTGCSCKGDCKGLYGGVKYGSYTKVIIYLGEGAKRQGKLEAHDTMDGNRVIEEVFGIRVRNKNGNSMLIPWHRISWVDYTEVRCD